MALEIKMTLNGLTLTELQERRIRRHLARLDRHYLARRPEPKAALVFRRHESQRRIELNMQVQLGPLGGHVVSHQTAETPEHAVRLAVDDIERQLERLRASLQGQPTYGVPSRRLPKQLRPHPWRRAAPAGREAATVSEAGAAPREEEKPV
jgi:ribosome-associated translation inhibitor RaiA